MSKSTAEIRQAFLDFFHSKGHQVVASSSLVPNNDPTLLFTNAGMNQFKDVFLGLDKRNYSRATTSQRCVRAGGKHNDLENVGYTARHHTFFEMLGNFSFGDYFKHDAIQYAWELLTGENWFNLPKERLWVTVYETDDEAYEIWEKEVGIPRERIIRIGDNKGAPYASDNFWQMGDTGPCGPCTEIFYDHGDHIWGGPPGSPEEDGDRYIEIWNIVFMQFNRQADGTMEPLPKPSVDTGMGLERIAAVLQHVNSNYEIDLFSTLIKAVAEVTGATDLNNKSLRVIADHIRSCAFLIADGVIPSNENRGYVLRRIIRRAIRHGNMLGAKDTFFYKLVGPLIGVMGSAGDELKRQQAQVEQVLKTEEEQFARTLERGLALLDDELAKDISDYETIAEYRDHVREDLEKQFNEEQESDYATRLMKAAVDNMTVEIPEPMVLAKLDEQLRNYISTMGVSPELTREQVLASMSLDEKTFQEIMRPQAMFEISTDLLLDAIVKAENIELGEGELDEMYQKMADEYKMEVDQIKQYVDEKIIVLDMKRRKAAQLIRDTAVDKEPEAKEEPAEAKEEAAE